jgi:hypothetical protein
MPSDTILFLLLATLAVLLYSCLLYCVYSAMWRTQEKAARLASAERQRIARKGPDGRQRRLSY